MPLPLSPTEFRALLDRQATEILAAKGMGKAGFTKRKRRPRGGKSRFPAVQLTTQFAPPRQQSVYVVGSGGQPIKVGIASDVSSRITSLQVGFPYELRAYYQVEIPDGRARDVERACHQRLSDYSTRGEWFAIDPYEAVETVKAVVAEMFPA